MHTTQKFYSIMFSLGLHNSVYLLAMFCTKRIFSFFIFLIANLKKKLNIEKHGAIGGLDLPELRELKDFFNKNTFLTFFIFGVNIFYICDIM